MFFAFFGGLLLISAQTHPIDHLKIATDFWRLARKFRGASFQLANGRNKVVSSNNSYVISPVVIEACLVEPNGLIKDYRQVDDAGTLYTGCAQK